MSSDFTTFGDFFYIFERLKRVFLNLEQLQIVSATYAYQMAVTGADSQPIDVFEGVAAFCQGFIFECVDEKQFIVRLA